MGDLLLGLGGRVGDVVEGLGRRGLVAGGQPLAGVGLHHHHAHAVGHDVVQLAGDAGPLQPDGLVGQASDSASSSRPTSASRWVIWRRSRITAPTSQGPSVTTRTKGLT